MNEKKNTKRNKRVLQICSHIKKSLITRVRGSHGNLKRAHKLNHLVQLRTTGNASHCIISKMQNIICMYLEC